MNTRPLSALKRPEEPTPTSRNNRDRLDFELDAVPDQPAYFHHARGRPDLPKKLRMDPPDLFPTRDIGDEHSGAHHLIKARPRLVQSLPDLLDGVPGLRLQVPHRLPLLIRPRRPGDENHVP